MQRSRTPGAPEPEPEPEPGLESGQEAVFESVELEVDFSSGEEQTEAELMADMTEDDQRNYRQEKVERYYQTKEWFLEVCPLLSPYPSICVLISRLPTHGKTTNIRKITSHSCLSGGGTSDT